ncbi:hypothetical protein Bca52824_043735 [Brassica carinata]|uniref:Phytocyanin domain-containing protein n=1 Tax=Brassica carinata TaxID=52824 RepID=A0A8X7V2C1_BRACI|nr:hypothetical protein Bca52824_043735 [Brassica carinata]
MFYIGGVNGDWVINPNESYNTWAARNRFQVNDTLYFKYAKGSDSVQLVTKADFEGCNIKNPLEKFDNGEAEVTLNRSGAFYFGQKLIVSVLDMRNHPNVPVSPVKAPTTAQPPKLIPLFLQFLRRRLRQPPEMIPPSPPAPSESTPTIKAPASSPKSAASGVAVTSVMTTVFNVALAVLMFV